MLDFEAFKQRYETVPVEEYPNNVREAVPEPVVSVHLLTYNHADYIREAIESVLMQEVGFPMEIILGDDDSSDGTREICIEYAKQHPDLIRLQLHHRENNIRLHGRPTHLFQYWYNTFNTRGNYIAVLSGDDYWTDPMKLQKQVEFLRNNSEYSYCYHRFQRLISGRGKNEESMFLTSPYKESWAAPSTMLARNVFDRLPKVCTEVLHEDTISKRILDLSGGKKLIEDIDPSVYRIHGESIYGGRKKLEKNLDLFRSNVKLIPYFSGTSVESKIRKDLDWITQKIVINTSLSKVGIVFSILRMAYRNNTGKQVSATVTRKIPYWIKQRIYDIARWALPERIYERAKSVLSK